MKSNCKENMFPQAGIEHFVAIFSSQNVIAVSPIFVKNNAIGSALSFWRTRFFVVVAIPEAVMLAAKQQGRANYDCGRYRNYWV